MAEASHCPPHPEVDKPIRAVVSYEAPREWEEWWPPPPQRLLIQVMLQSILFVVWLARNGGGCFPRRTGAFTDTRRVDGARLNTQLTQQYVIGEIAVPVHVGVGELSGAHAQRAAELTVQEARAGLWCVSRKQDTMLP